MCRQVIKLPAPRNLAMEAAVQHLDGFCEFCQAEMPIRDLGAHEATCGLQSAKAKAAAATPTPEITPPAPPPADFWSCRACTLHNSRMDLQVCELCGTPRQHVDLFNGEPVLLREAGLLLRISSKVVFRKWKRVNITLTRSSIYVHHARAHNEPTPENALHRIAVHAQVCPEDIKLRNADLIYSSRVVAQGGQVLLHLGALDRLKLKRVLDQVVDIVDTL